MRSGTNGHLTGRQIRKTKHETCLPAGRSETNPKHQNSNKDQTTSTKVQTRCHVRVHNRMVLTGVLQNAAQIDVSPYFTLGFSNENEGFMPFCKTPGPKLGLRGLFPGARRAQTCPPPGGQYSPGQHPGCVRSFWNKPCKGGTKGCANRCYALSGLLCRFAPYPGRRFALPWAGLSLRGSCQPFRLKSLNLVPLGTVITPALP